MLQWRLLQVQKQINLKNYYDSCRATTKLSLLHAYCVLVLLQARGRVPGKTGVWVGERKIGAVGVCITHGISSHGIALNVTTDLRAYQHIVPCGTPDKEMTSVLQELQRPGQMHSSSSSCVTNSSFLVDHAAGLTGVHQGHQRGQQQQLQTTGGAGAALMLAAEACLVSALARMTKLDVVTN
jgi:lipoate-protein ligase B